MLRKWGILGFCIVSAAFWAMAGNVVHAEDPYTVHLTARDGRFYPDTLNAPAGQREKVVLPGKVEAVKLKDRAGYK